MGLLFFLCAGVIAASDLNGEVTFGGFPVPGATVNAAQSGKERTAVTDPKGRYRISGLSDGNCAVEIRMLGFETLRQDVGIEANTAVVRSELQMLPIERIQAIVQNAPAPVPEVTATPPQPPAEARAAKESGDEDLNQRAADGLLINGSSQNGAASPFAQFAAFGNNRLAQKGLFNGGIGITFDNSSLDARPFSLTGLGTPKASYNRLTGLATLGGPIQIPRLFKRPPVFFVQYQWTRNRTAAIATGLMPEGSQRDGLFPGVIIDPTTGAPFANNAIPRDRLSPQAQALLRLYPLPNVSGNAAYNYQIPLLSAANQDALQSRMNKTLGNRDQVYGKFAFESLRTSSPNLFEFLETSSLLGIDAGANWSHRVDHSWFLNLGYQYSRLATHWTPYFANRDDVSGQAGITGNDRSPANWGPPALSFSSGLAPLSDGISSFDRNQSSGMSAAARWIHSGHNVTLGGDFRREEFNDLSQQNPRGTFTFTGAASGSDFADFLLGIPDTSAIAFGNADKYFRQSVYDAFVNDDWRINPDITLNAGVRWEYGAPMSELYGRLVNLDLAPGYAAASQVTGNGSIHRDRHAVEPRVGLAWRPVSGSSLVVRAGYGVYYDTSVYQTIAVQMAQQPPFSKTLAVPNSAADPLTLADGFVPSAGVTSNTFAVDPNFRVGYAQNWQLSLQRDLPGSLQMTATYLGIKGTRGAQYFLPNTYPAGEPNPCAACPSGFAYLTSNGNSTRQAGQIQLRRRLHNGLAGILQYTFAKSIDDDAALGGQGANASSQNSPSAASPSSGGLAAANLAIVQNWLDLAAERGLSTFDQRHLLGLQLQYSTGMGLRGGTLLTGWKAALFKEWNFATQISAGSGLPETPVDNAAVVSGTGVTGTIRPNYTGAPLYSAPQGRFLNPAAYVAPPAGQWGNAGRDSITGPAQFSLNASLGRTFRLSDRLNLDLRVDSTNALNHVVFTAWNTVVNSPQFGLPVSANAMRSMQTTLRLRF